MTNEAGGMVVNMMDYPIYHWVILYTHTYLVGG